jgi:hypothetical protein
MYFDDPGFLRIRNSTRCFNEAREYLFGGEGQSIHIDSSFCFGLCIRAQFPFMCCPFFFPEQLCPCMIQENIHVEDAESAINDIHKAQSSAKARMNIK